MRKEIDKLHTGELYLPYDKSVAEVQFKCLDMLYEFNKIKPSDFKKKNEYLKKMFAEIGENCRIEGTLNANFGGRHVHFGNNVYANFNLTLVDDTHIYVGDNVMFAPNVTVATATHPVDPELRKLGAQFNLPVKIEHDVWIGTGVIILPGVTIGANSVIGAGSVVTKDIPADVVAYGNPCKVARKITKKDKEYYYKDFKVPKEIKKYIKDSNKS